MSVELKCSNISCSAIVELPDVADEDRFVLTFDPISGGAFLTDAGPRVDVTPAEGWTFSSFDEGWLCPRCTKEL